MTHDSTPSSGHVRNDPTRASNSTSAVTTAQAVLDAIGAQSLVVLLDCRFELSNPSAGRQAHQTSHPLGARFADLEDDLSAPKSAVPTSPAFTGRHPLPERSVFAATLGRLGITPQHWVVAFDAHGGPYASRAWWMLRWMGHQRVSVLDGGMAAWINAGGAMTDAPTRFTASAPYPFSDAPSMPVVNASRLQDRLTKVLLLDARAADRFRGENETFDPVAGHIPGARRRTFRDNLAPDGRFLPAATLKTQWQTIIGNDAWNLGETSDVVQQCGSGVTACQNIVALVHAGGPVTALYPGSWSEWSADPIRPRALGD